MMSNNQINKFFEENYTWLKKITTANVYANNSRNKDVDECISLMYMHVIKHQHKITNEDILIDYCGKYSIQNTYWNNSEYNKIAQVNNKVTTIEDYTNFDVEDVEGDIFNKEEQMEERWKLIDLFIQQLPEKWERRYATVYFNYIRQGIRPSVRTLNKHFGIGHVPSQKIKKEFETKLNLWLQETLEPSKNK